MDKGLPGALAVRVAKGRDVGYCWRMNFLKRFRVKPGTRVRLADFER
jgi:hypothetical protein